MRPHDLDQGNPTAVPEEIAQLEAHVRARLNGCIHNVHLVLCQGGLIIQGLAHSYYTKQIAQHLVMERTNLPIVANEIEVI